MKAAGTFATIFTLAVVIFSHSTHSAPVDADVREAETGAQISNNEISKDSEDKFCLLEGKRYQHGENVTRADPCEMCLCFSGEVLCWLVSCPLHSPRNDCRAIPMENICCPVYECPLSSNSSSEDLATSFSEDISRTVASEFANETDNYTAAEMTTDRFNETNLSYINLDNITATENATEIATCIFKGQYYKQGDLIPPASGPCIDCKCGTHGKIHCSPHTCAAAIVMDEGTKGDTVEGVVRIREENSPLMISTQASPTSHSYNKPYRSQFGLPATKKPTGTS